MIIDYRYPCDYCQQYYAIVCYEFPSHLSSATIKAGILPTFVKLLSFRAPVGKGLSFQRPHLANYQMLASRSGY